MLTMCHWSPDELSPWAVAQPIAEQGYRVLALAEGIAPETLEPTKVPPEPANLTLLEFVGMIDPLRPGAQSVFSPQ